MPPSEGHLPDSPRPGSALTALRRMRKSARVWLALGASATLAAILTLDWTPRGSGPLGGWLPQQGDIADRSYKATVELALVDRDATEGCAAPRRSRRRDLRFRRRRLAQVREVWRRSPGLRGAARQRGAGAAAPGVPAGAGRGGQRRARGHARGPARGKFQEDERAAVAWSARSWRA
jgi:hypothetical protein